MKIPRHLAIIMDGNGRWAKNRHRDRTFGHIKGTRVAKQVILDCSRMGVEFLTLYAFSAENWLRPQREISFLMRILRRYLEKETRNLVKENIRFSVIGDLGRLPEDVLKSIEHAMTETRDCTGLRLIFAISYGSRQEITEAMKKLAEKVRAGELAPEQIDEMSLEENLETSGCPDPDLILRTSGEQRISNFLLWQSAYSEFYFTPVLWPDFNKAELVKAFEEYTKRDRRFGKSSSGSVSDEQLRH